MHGVPSDICNQPNRIPCSPNTYANTCASTVTLFSSINWRIFIFNHEYWMDAFIGCGVMVETVLETSVGFSRNFWTTTKRKKIIILNPILHWRMLPEVVHMECVLVENLLHSVDRLDPVFSVEQMQQMWWLCVSRLSPSIFNIVRLWFVLPMTLKRERPLPDRSKRWMEFNHLLLILWKSRSLWLRKSMQRSVSSPHSLSVESLVLRHSAMAYAFANGCGETP